MIKKILSISVLKLTLISNNFTIVVNSVNPLNSIKKDKILSPLEAEIDNWDYFEWKDCPILVFSNIESKKSFKNTIFVKNYHSILKKVSKFRNSIGVIDRDIDIQTKELKNLSIKD